MELFYPFSDLWNFLSLSWSMELFILFLIYGTFYLFLDLWNFLSVMGQHPQGSTFESDKGTCLYDTQTPLKDGNRGSCSHFLNHKRPTRAPSVKIAFL